MQRNEQGNPAAYLGDGAYAEFDGMAVNVYADRDGVRHWVALEPQAFSEFLRFCVGLGLRSVYLSTGAERVGAEELCAIFEETLMRNLNILTAGLADGVCELPANDVRAMLKACAANLAQGFADRVVP